MFAENTLVINENQRKYMLNVFQKMFGAVCLTGFVAYIVSISPKILASLFNGMMYILMIAEFAIVITLNARINRLKLDTANLLLYIYSGLLGFSLAPFFLLYTGESIASCFFVAAAFFGILCIYGYTTKKDLTKYSTLLISGLICLIVSSIIDIVFLGNMFNLLLNFIGLCIFAGLTAYNMQSIKNFYDTGDKELSAKLSVLGALSLYINFLNIFISLLRIFGDRR